MNPERLRLLLSGAAFLAIIRLILVPWFDYQSGQRDVLLLLTTRLERFESLLRSQDAIFKDNKRLLAALDEARSVYPLTLSADAYRLASQQQLSAIAQECGVIVTLFDVVLDGTSDTPTVKFLRVRVNVEGPLNRIAKFHAEIEGGLPSVAVRGMTIGSPAFPVSNGGDAQVQGSIVLDLHFFVDGYASASGDLS